MYGIARAIPISIALLLAGCGTVVPGLNETGNDADAILLVHAIVDSIHCELRNSIATVVENEGAGAKFDPKGRPVNFLTDFETNWGVQVGLTLQIDERTTLNPTTMWSPHSALSSIFTVSGGAALSTDATRIEKLNYFYKISDLIRAKRCRGPMSQPPAPGSLLIQSDLKLAEWLSAQFVEVETVAIGAPQGPNTVLRQNALSHQVTFDVVTTGTFTPTWKLTRANFNQSGTLFSTTRDRKHDLLLTFGPIDPKSYGTLAPTAQGLHLTSQIVQAINSIKPEPGN